MLLDALVVLVLVVLNGFLALSELALVSSRRSRLQAMADSGHRGARSALALAEQPGHVLSAVQIGITAVGLVAGAFSGAAIAEPFALWLEAAGVADHFSDFIAFAVVVVAVTYVSLIIGELVPKQIALQNPEAMACRVAPAMMLVTRLAWPLVVFLNASSNAVLHLVGRRGKRQSTVIGEEIKALIAEAESAGVMPPQARSMISGVMRLADRTARAVMTPRSEVEWIDLDGSDSAIRERLKTTRHSRLPAGSGSLDVVKGVIQVKDILDEHLHGPAGDVRAHVREAPVVIDTIKALQAMELLRSSQVHMLLVVDEYGAFEGLITTTNILEAIAGAFPIQGDEAVPTMVQRSDGSWLLDGALPIDEMAEALGVVLPGARDYYTVAGFALASLRHVPRAGESFTYRGWRFEVVDMDERRIDKVLAMRLTERRQFGT